MAKHIETVIIGAGQAGLSTSYFLKKQNRRHIILEQSTQVADQWRNHRWDSFALVSPNWALQLPGAPYNGTNADGFLKRDEMVKYLEQYAQQFELPIQFNTRVTAVEQKDDEFHIETSSGKMIAENVVVATGFFQEPKYPVSPTALSSSIKQMHSSQYKNPGSLAPGGVLVVGSGQSGCQIAEELNAHGRKVFLSIGNAGRAPRRYRGKDILRWLFDTGFFNLTPEQLPPGMGKFDGIPHLSGVNGGHTINLHQLAKNGIQLLGHVQSVEGRFVTILPDMHQTLAKVDQFEKDVTSFIDQFIESNALRSLLEELPQLRYGFDQPIITELDLVNEGIFTVIWATGYWFDYSLLKMPVLDKDGFPIQDGGLAKIDGLFFVGMPWMPSEKSGFLIGVGESARNIAYHIAERAKT